LRRTVSEGRGHNRRHRTWAKRGPSSQVLYRFLGVATKREKISFEEAFSRKRNPVLQIRVVRRKISPSREEEVSPRPSPTSNSAIKDELQGRKRGNDIFFGHSEVLIPPREASSTGKRVRQKTIIVRIGGRRGEREFAAERLPRYQ